MVDESSALQTRMDGLAALARSRLPSMVDPETGLYVHKAVWSGDNLQLVRTNDLYSAITAVGLASDDPAGPWSPSLQSTADTLVSRAWTKSLDTAAVATTVWLLVLLRDQRAGDLLDLLASGLTPRRSSSMQLGLVLTAAAAVLEAASATAARSNLATATHDELLRRFEDRAQLFRGTAGAQRPRQAVRKNLTSFASQVYPMHGLAEFARVTGRTVPRQASRAAATLVDAQGPLGQWWWIYSTRNGSVLDGYPVYSVHQHGMAFMALAPLEGLGGPSYRRELARGVEWLFGDNELRRSLVDDERRSIARCLQRRGADADGPSGMSPAQWRRVVWASWGLRPPVGTHDGGPFELLEEARPYELGWLLYARSLVGAWV
jgi:hypothetical protein